MKRSQTCLSRRRLVREIKLFRRIFHKSDIVRSIKNMENEHERQMEENTFLIF